MISIISKLFLVLLSLSLVSCGGYKTVYKPVSYKEPTMSYPNAVEYCNHIADLAYQKEKQRYNDQSESKYLEEKRIKLEEMRIRALNPSYSTTLDCRKSSFSNTVNCTGGSKPKIGYTTPLNLEKRYVKPILSSHLAGASAENIAFKNCMFEKGYKQVKVKKDGSYSENSTAINARVTPKNNLVGSNTAISKNRMKNAMLYLSGKGGVEKDYYKAFAILEDEAKEKNNPVAYFWLAALYSHGNGVEQDKNKATELNIKAAKLGSLLARGSILSDYIKGKDSGINLDQETAEKWLKEVIDKRDSTDKDIEGLALRSKKSSKKLNEIIEWFKENTYNKSSVKYKKKDFSINTTGNWKGTWTSVNGKDGGDANLTIVQNEGNISGLFNIEDSPCLKSGSVVGLISDSDIAMNIASGEHKIQFVAPNSTNKIIKGDYEAIQGKCKGSKGSVILLRDN